MKSLINDRLFLITAVGLITSLLALYFKMPFETHDPLHPNSEGVHIQCETDIECESTTGISY